MLPPGSTISLSVFSVLLTGIVPGIVCAESINLKVGQTTTYTTGPVNCLAADTITVTSGDVTKVTVASPATKPVIATPQSFTISKIAAGPSNINVGYTCAGSVGSKSVAITDGDIKTGGDDLSGGEAEDPISTFSGELFKQLDADINLGGTFPLSFSRYYASRLKTANIVGTLGDNWRHNYEWTLSSFGNGTVAQIVSSTGRTISFSRRSNSPSTTWVLIDRTDVSYQLEDDRTTGDIILADSRSNTTYLFSPAGQLQSITDNFGNTHTLTYNAGGQLTQVADGLGRTLNFSYNATGKLISVDDGLGRNAGFAYTANDLTSVTDLLGNTTTYSYAAGGLLAGTTRALNNTVLTQAWNANGQVTSQTDALNNTTTLAYAGNNTSITNAPGNIMTHTHTAKGELSNVARRDNTSLALAYNTEGRRSGITDSLGATTSFTYDKTPPFSLPKSGRLTSTTHANGATTSRSFFSNRTRGFSRDRVTLFDLSRITHADSTVENFTYDSFSGGLLSRTDQAGNITAFTLKLNGQWLTRSNPTGGGRVRTYNADSTVATDKLATNGLAFGAGNTTRFTYDGFRRLASITFADATADASTRSFTYDSMDHPLTVTDGKGGITTMVYNANGNLTSRTDRMGAITATTYDAMDRISKVTDANGAFSTRSYDVLRHLASTTDRNGNSVSFAYDTQNRLNAITDGNGNISRRSFDTEGILATTTTPLGHVTTFTSNNMGRITQISSPLGNNVQMAYDTMGRVTSVTDPLGNISSNTYDANGLIASRTLPGAIAASYTRNGLNRITQVTDPNGNNWLRVFDKVGRMTTATDPLTRASAFAYDNRNRVSVVTFPTGLGTRTNTYDANGNLTRRLYSDATDLNFTFDAEDRLLTANGLALTRDNLGRITNSNGIAMAYDAGGRITTLTFAAGKAVTYTYDANNNVATVTDWVGGTSTFTYDADNRLVSMIRPNGVTTTYSYDIDGRLSGFVDGALGITTLTRNAKGQITAASRTVPTVASSTGMTAITYSFDVAAQVSTAGFTYDALGRQTNNGATTFTWDLASRLTSAGATTTHTYDGIGYRLSRTTAAGTRNYVWNLALDMPSVSIEKQGAADLRYYVHTPGGLLLYSIDATGNAHHFYHFDETGNTRFVSNDAGAVEASYAYSPFGVVQASTGVLNNPFAWQGQFGIFDDGNGLYYIRARYYDGNSGRFISKDPIKSIAPKQINPYQYALNDPLIFVDVRGTDPNAAIQQKLNDQFGIRKIARAKSTGYAIYRGPSTADAIPVKLIVHDGVASTFDANGNIIITITIGAAEELDFIRENGSDTVILAPIGSVSIDFDRLAETDGFKPRGSDSIDVGMETGADFRLRIPLDATTETGGGLSLGGGLVIPHGDGIAGFGSRFREEVVPSEKSQRKTGSNGVDDFTPGNLDDLGDGESIL